jgi:hypothetical protein
MLFQLHPKSQTLYITSLLPPSHPTINSNNNHKKDSKNAFPRKRKENPRKILFISISSISEIMFYVEKAFNSRKYVMTKQLGFPLR